MGIFTVPTVSVRKTRIFVSPSSSIPGEQLTIYKSEINTHFEDGFLILPVPYPQTIEFHHPSIPLTPTQSPFLDFLNQVEVSFDDPERRRQPPAPYNPGNLASFDHLDVLESMDELRQFNERENILHPATLNQLEEIYHQPYWGFILCSLRQGSFVYEPLCYTHRMIDERLFIPSLIYQPRAFNDVLIPDQSDRFDDRYFMNGCEYSADLEYRVTEVDIHRIHHIPWGVLPLHYRECLRYFLSESRRGNHWNTDAYYHVNESLYRDYRPRERRNSDEFYSYSPITSW